MNPQRYGVTAAVLLLIAAVASVVVFKGGGNTAQAAHDVTQAFLQSEFNGEVLDERKRLITFSAKRLAEVERDDPGPGPGPYVLYSASRPVFVVSAAEIVSVEVDGNRATAVVSYRRLARIDNFGTGEAAVLLGKKDNDLVTLNLVFVKAKWWSLKSQWWVLDPPPPRVRKLEPIMYYTQEVEKYCSVWAQELNDPANDPEQKASVRRRRDLATGNLRILKSLP